MDKTILAGGISLVLAGLVGLVYGIGINLQGMLARGASDYSFIGSYIAEWALVLLAGILITVAARKR